MTDEAIYRRNDVLWRSTYDRVHILVPGRDGILTLQGSGHQLWAALEEPGSVQALAQRLAAVYAASAEDIAADIAPVIEDLSRNGAVIVSTVQ